MTKNEKLILYVTFFWVVIHSITEIVALVLKW